MRANRTPPSYGLPEISVTTRAASTHRVSTHSACSSMRPRWAWEWWTISPPASAPAANAPSATNEAAREKPGAPANAKPEKTTLPVMFATKTRPSCR